MASGIAVGLLPRALALALSPGKWLVLTSFCTSMNDLSILG